MENDPSRLIAHCVCLLDCFDPEAIAIEDHIRKYLEDNSELQDEGKDFIIEVCDGCSRYQAVLDVLIQGFYRRDGLQILHSERNLYKVYAYLAFFRLDELGMSQFRKLVMLQDPNKMHKFLQFIFNDKNLKTWIKDEWCKIYEGTFVQTKLLSPITRWLPELHDMLGQMNRKIANSLKIKSSQSKATEPKPFNITKPRPRSIPIPDVIPKLAKHRPIPEAVYSDPKEIDVLAQIRNENRRKAEERLMEASKVQFACANPEKSDKTKQRMRDIMQTEEQKLNFNKSKAHKIPSSMMKGNIPIKLNTAAILREGKLYEKRETEELKILEKLEAGHKDTSEFESWQKKMKEKDLETQLAEIERRRLEGKLSYEEAISARQDMIKENKKKVGKMKEEAKRLMDEYLQRRMIEEQDMRKLVEAVLDTHENAKDAKKKLHEYKAKIVQELHAESRELMRQALEEAEEEMRNKMELISQIRAMEALPVNRNKLVDLTQKAGYGFLGEMSIAELKERLSFLRLKQNDEEESRRDEILAAKQAKDEKLMETLETISRHRVEQNRSAALRLEQRKKTHLSKPEVKDEKLSELQIKLEEKRAARRKAQEKTSTSAQPTRRIHQLQKNKRDLEESRWSELEKTREKNAFAAKLTNSRASKVAHTGTMLFT